MFGAYVDGVIIAAGINALLALGLYITVSTGQFSVGHGGFMAIGAYVASVLTMKFGVPLIPAMMAAGACAFVVGGLIGLPVMRFDMIYLAMATLGFGEIVRSILSTIDYVGGVNGMRGMSGVTIWHVLVTFAIVLAAAWLHDRSRLGLAYSAVRQDADAALAMGIDVRKVKVGAVFSSSGMTVRKAHGRLSFMMPPFAVAGATIGTFNWFATGKPTSPSPLVNGPMMASTLSTVAIRRMMLGTSRAFAWLSYSTSLIIIPLTPPALLMSSAARRTPRKAFLP